MSGSAIAQAVAHLGARSITVLDVGARWGNAGAWWRLEPLAKMVGFEPDHVECARLNATAEAGCRFEPVALASVDGKATLHLTSDPSCCSLYAPNQKLIDRYPALGVMAPVGTAEVPTRSLDSWAAEAGCTDIRFIKIDVQGTELDVLRGATRALQGCVGLEVEVEFVPLYNGPLFSDVDQYLREHGFSLWRLSHLVHYSEHRRETPMTRTEVAVYDNVVVQHAASTGRLAWGNAIYFRDYAGLEQEADLLVLAALLEACGDLDGADGALLRRLTLKGQPT